MSYILHYSVHSRLFCLYNLRQETLGHFVKCYLVRPCFPYAKQSGLSCTGNERVQHRLLQSRIPPLFFTPSRHPAAMSIFIPIPPDETHVALAHHHISTDGQFIAYTVQIICSRYGERQRLTTYLDYGKTPVTELKSVTRNLS